ncbi:hypothetical protein [Nocardia sp. NPDC051570]|uniref:hypothetical protein n=1 Tax=Nocardia sp. NPDC051570 TaxID=3364324 RepID=UPI0037A094DF
MTTAPNAPAEVETTPTMRTEPDEAADAGASDGAQGGEQVSDDASTPETDESATDEPKGSQADDPRLRSARNDAAKYRTRASQAENDLTSFKQQVGKLFGFVSEDEANDPKKLTGQLKSAVQEANGARVELAVYRAAGKDIDADALLDSRAFASVVSKIDLTADDFTAQVAAEITKAVEKNPKLRLAPAIEAPKPPKRSGSDTSSGKGENSGQLTYAQYQALTPAARAKAVKEGRANQILGRK